jgi:hypothetical protein
MLASKAGEGQICWSDRSLRILGAGLSLHAGEVDGARNALPNPGALT